MIAKNDIKIKAEKGDQPGITTYVARMMLVASVTIQDDVGRDLHGNMAIAMAKDQLYLAFQERLYGDVRKKLAGEFMQIVKYCSHGASMDQVRELDAKFNELMKMMTIRDIPVATEA